MNLNPLFAEPLSSIESYCALQWKSYESIFNARAQKGAYDFKILMPKSEGMNNVKTSTGYECVDYIWIQNSF